MIIKRIVVAAVIVDDLTQPTRVLAARRSRPSELRGLWEFPGGKLESGELPTDALRREIGEELDVSITIGAELPGPENGQWPITTTFAMRVWCATIAHGQPIATDAHSELRWMPVARLHDLPWVPADLGIVTAVLSRFSPLPDPS